MELHASTQAERFLHGVRQAQFVEQEGQADPKGQQELHGQLILQDQRGQHGLLAPLDQ